MQINHSKINFKANVENVAPAATSSVATNPLNNSKNEKTSSLPNVTPSYDVKVPLKYTDLGERDLGFSTIAHLYKMENGQKVVIIPKKGATVVKSYVNTGSMNEPDNLRGISHFIEHNLFNGSSGLKAGEFFETVNKMGAETNASTGFAQTDYYISSHLLKKSDLENQLRIHSNMIESPLFAVNMLEKEKGPVTSEISMILDEPGNIATNTTLKSLYNINSTSKDIIGGTVDNINNLKREDVVDYYQTNYYPGDMVTVISGEVDPEETMKLVSKCFTSKKSPTKQRKFENLVPIEKSVRKDIISDKANSAIVSIGFNGPNNNNTRDKILLDALQYVLLGSSVSRLCKPLELINSNAIISTDRVSNRPEDGRVVLLETQTSEQNVERVLNTIFKQIEGLEKNPPTKEELDIVKKKLKLCVAQMFESSEVINSAVGAAMLDNDLESVSEFNNVIDSMTSKDIVDFAKKYMNLHKAAITVIHPSTAASEDTINTNYQNARNVAFTGNVDKNSDINHKEAVNMSKVKQFSITNNIDLVTNESESDVSTLDLDLTADAPTYVKPGVNELLAIMLNKGSKDKDEASFFSNLEKQSIELQFDASARGICARATFLPTDGADVIKSAKEVLLNPRFNEEEFESAKKMLKDNLMACSKNSHEVLMKEFFPNESHGDTVDDMLKNIDDIKLNDIQSLYQYIINNAQAKCVITAPLDANPEVKKGIFKELATDFPVFNTPKPVLFNNYKATSQAKVITQEHNKSQAEIEMGYKYKISGNLKDSVTFGLLNTILGGTPSSRLFQDLREKQKLAYHVSSHLDSCDNTGVLSLYIKSTTDDVQSCEIHYDNLQKSIEGFQKHVNALKKENVTQDELDCAKEHLKNEILDSSALTSGQTSTLMNGLSSFYGVADANQALELIDKITVDDIKTCANYAFSGKPVISAVATKNTIDANKDYLEKLQKSI